jgi:hypothetical protein
MRRPPAVDVGLVIRCQDCATPIARLVDGVLVIEAKHHGQRHTAKLSAAELVKLMLAKRPA